VGCANLEDLTSLVIEAGFAPENCQQYQVSGYYSEQQGSTQPKWLAFCGVKG